MPANCPLLQYNDISIVLVLQNQLLPWCIWHHDTCEALHKECRKEQSWTIKELREASPSLTPSCTTEQLWEALTLPVLNATGRKTCSLSLCRCWNFGFCNNFLSSWFSLPLYWALGFSSKLEIMYMQQRRFSFDLKGCQKGRHCSPEHVGVAFVGREISHAVRSWLHALPRYSAIFCFPWGEHDRSSL